MSGFVRELFAHFLRLIVVQCYFIGGSPLCTSSGSV